MQRERERKRQGVFKGLKSNNVALDPEWEKEQEEEEDAGEVEGEM